MQKILLSILVTLSITVQYSHAQSDSTAKANQLVKMEQALADALPVDSTLWSKYLDPAWHMVSEDGSGFFKKEFMQSFSPATKGVTLKVYVTKPVVVFHDNIAVISYVADEHENFFGNELHTTYGTMDTWYKKDTSWVMLSMQDFEIPQLPPSVKIPAETLKLYTGTYKMAALSATISLKNDTLFMERNKHKAVPLFPETSSVFFITSDTRGRKIFIKDGAGKMLMRERRNGQDVVWVRER